MSTCQVRSSSVSSPGPGAYAGVMNSQVGQPGAARKMPKSGQPGWQLDAEHISRFFPYHYSFPAINPNNPILLIGFDRVCLLFWMIDPLIPQFWSSLLSFDWFYWMLLDEFNHFQPLNWFAQLWSYLWQQTKKSAPPVLVSHWAQVLQDTY